MNLVSKTESIQFYPDSDEKFFFFVDINDENGHFIAQEIKMIEVQYSGYKKVTVLRDDDPNTSLLSLSVDQSNDYLILVYKTDTQFSGSSKSEFKFKMYDFQSNSIIYEAQITDKLLIGRLKSGLFTFADGHIYFNNNAIKIRYDLILAGNNQRLNENEIFDYYSEVISNLGDGRQKVKSETPLDSI